MTVKVIPISPEYRENWERVFGELMRERIKRVDHCPCCGLFTRLPHSHPVLGIQEFCICGYPAMWVAPDDLVSCD
jgi:hypothetical protein